MAALSNLVRVLSLTTGTGTLTLGSALTGFLNPTQAGMIDGVTYSYAIEADYTTVGDDLVPTSREIGLGVYTASGTTLTRSVINSTNGNALLNLAGDEQVIITLNATMIREVLTGPRTYYVRTDGNDNNSGLANTAGGAFLTHAGAIAAISAKVDNGGYDVTISAQNTTWTAPINVSSFPLGIGALIFDFNGGSLTVTTGHAILVSVAFARVYVANVTISASAAGATALLARGARSVLSISSGVTIGATSGPQLYADNGSMVSNYINGFIAYTISGGGTYHHYASGPGSLCMAGGSVTITGTPAFGTAFAGAVDGCSVSWPFATFTGSATGPRYSATDLGMVNTFTGNVNYLPGNSAGSTARGGQYN